MRGQILPQRVFEKRRCDAIGSVARHARGDGVAELFAAACVRKEALNVI